MLKTLKNYWEKKNEHTSQRTHVQNHAYASKSRHKYVCNVHQLSNPVVLVITWKKYYKLCGETLKSSQNSFTKIIWCWTQVNILLCVLVRIQIMRHISFIIWKWKTVCKEKTLGIIIDNKLKFKSHVKKLCKKASQNV